MNFFSKKSVVGSPQLKNERKISYKYTTKFSILEKTLQDFFAEIFEKKMVTPKNYARNVRHHPCSRIHNIS